MTDERRQSPRVRILGRLHGQEVALATPVTVREISLGGLRVETPVPFPEGAEHAFHLTLGDGAAVTVSARAVHCQPVDTPDGPPLYLTGFRFVDDAPATDVGAIGGLLDKLT